jgi:hypothetical protein
MRVSTRWAELLAQFGNLPGTDAGSVTVHLNAPLEGRKTWELPSADCTIAAEAGSVVGLVLELDSGRRVFVPAGSVVAVIDSPEDTQ